MILLVSPNYCTNLVTALVTSLTWLYPCCCDLNKAPSCLLNLAAPFTTKTRLSRKLDPGLLKKHILLSKPVRNWSSNGKNYDCALSTARAAYFSHLISDIKQNLGLPFNIVAYLTQKQSSLSCSRFTAHDFLIIF